MLHCQPQPTSKKLSFINKRESGFTLLELIIVIIILGVMSVGISGFISLTTQTYLNVSERDDLLSSARFAVERLNREIRNAVPNSIRVSNNAAKQCIEFVPIKASTIYTDIPVTPDIKSEEISVVSFININDDPYTCSGTCADFAVVYPLTSSDIYNFDIDSGDGKVTQFNAFTNMVGDIWTLPIKPTGGMVFDEHSPTNRLYVFDSTVSYCVENFRLSRFQSSSFNINQALPLFADSVLMAENITYDVNDLPFKFSPPTLQRNGVVQIKLNFDRDGEIIAFNNDVHIENVP